MDSLRVGVAADDAALDERLKVAQAILHGARTDLDKIDRMGHLLKVLAWGHGGRR